MHEEGYDHTDALFGVPFIRNRSITGHVVYLTPNMDISQSDHNGCQSYSVDIPISTLTEPNLVYLVDRGGCSFAQKTSLAQEHGAKALLVQNDECLTSDVKFLETLKLSKEDIFSFCCDNNFVSKNSPSCSTNLETTFDYLPFMVSTTSSLSISIPAMLISVTDSFKVKTCLCLHSSSSSPFCDLLNDKSSVFHKLKSSQDLSCSSPTSVVAQLTLDTPHPDGIVSFDLFTKPELLHTKHLSRGARSPGGTITFWILSSHQGVA